MRRTMIIVVQLALIFLGFVACKTNDLPMAENPDTEAAEDSNFDSTPGRMVVKVGTRTFSATLANNATARAFKARLPLTISMDELNGNEKLYRFSENLPSNPSTPGTIQSGDLMLYTSNTLVLFYKTFPTSYTYTRIGKIDNVTGLAAALGAGNVTVNFALE